MNPPEETFAYHDASIEIAAAPEAVYDLVSDITRMGEWSPEATGGRWTDGGSGKAGDWFTGTNANPQREWERECEVVTADRGKDFTFVVGGVEHNRTWWSFEMEPVGAGTKLTERWWIANKSPALLDATDEQVQARVDLTAEMLPATLAAMKKTAESGS